MPCNCEGFDYIDKDHQHVVAGDLWIIRNKKLKSLFTKGPKYKENEKERAKASIMEGLNDCIDIWCNKLGGDKSLLTEWK